MFARPPAWLPGLTTPLIWRVAAARVTPSTSACARSASRRPRGSRRGGSAGVRRHRFPAFRRVSRCRRGAPGCPSPRPGRVGGDAEEAVRAAALQAHLQMAGRHRWRAHRGSPRGSSAFTAAMPASIVSARAAAVLHHERFRGPAGREPCCGRADPPIWLPLAAQADDQHAARLGWRCIARHGTAQQVDIGSPVSSMPQPVAVGEAATPSMFGYSPPGARG